MGCKAFTPPLVGLARELEGQPFQLVASHNQNADARTTRHEIFQNGLALDTSNVTVTRAAGHPGVKGTGYVPYYLVFDHHGDLAYHHQGGPYHGGDGDAVHDRVRAMLRDVPQVYVGREPYEQHAKLAREIASGKRHKSALARLHAALEEAPADGELLRLCAAIERLVASQVAELERIFAVDPKRAYKLLDAAREDSAGTRWSGPLDEVAERYGDRVTRQKIEDGAKLLTATMKRWRRLAPVQGNGGEVHNPLDEEFRDANLEPLGACRG